MPAHRSVLDLVGAQAPPVDTESNRKKCAETRRAVLAKAHNSVRELNEMLTCINRELAEGDLDLADLIMSAR